MPDKGKFDLGDYVEVKDRIAILLELFPQSRITTTYELTSEPDEKPKVICRALVYRNPEDPHPATGTSWMYLPGTTSYTRGSEIENAETSAVGRAIGLMGILIDRSIATVNEIESKQEPANHPTPPQNGNGLIGVVEAGDKTTSDFELRYDPDGIAHLGFRLKGDRGGILVEAAGELAEDLMVSKGDLVGQRVTAWGRIGDRSFPRKDGKFVTYQALELERLTGPDGLVFPVVHEAPTVPLFPEEVQAELDQIAANL